MYNPKLLTIIKAYKTWHYYLKDCKFKIFILINYNKSCYFMDIKSLNFCQV